MADAELADEMRSLAEDFARIAGEQGYTLDFTPGSVETVERMIDEIFTGRKRFGRGRADRPDPQYASVAPAAGAYVGEVIVRNHEGSWDTHETFGPGVVVGDNWSFPVGKAIGRFENGSEDSLDYFYRVLTEDVLTG